MLCAERAGRREMISAASGMSEQVTCGRVVRRIDPCAHRHREKGTSTRCPAVYVVTDSLGLGIRENRTFMRLAA